jgi:hypothetical protein
LIAPERERVEIILNASKAFRHMILLKTINNFNVIREKERHPGGNNLADVINVDEEQQRP